MSTEHDEYPLPTRNEFQRDLLTLFCGQVRDALLAKSDEWPADWDGFELRWLAEEAFRFEASTRQEHRRRHQAFLKEWRTRDLYRPLDRRVKHGQGRSTS